MADKSVIMYDSPEAASIKTITGWVSSAGRFWGDNEHMARYDGSTHMKCKNNPDHPMGVGAICDYLLLGNSIKPGLFTFWAGILFASILRAFDKKDK